MSNTPKSGTTAGKKSNVATLLTELNTTYLKIHRTYERYFWLVYMGDKSLSNSFEKAQIARENFRTNETLAAKVDDLLTTATGKDKVALTQWQWFFSKYQTPVAAKEIFNSIVKLEKDILNKLNNRTEGYIHPKTKKFIKASRAQMSDIMATDDDEQVRKACFTALENLALTCTKEFIDLVALRNQYARALGYEDFYAYKVKTEEDLTKTELFKIFDEIYDQTKYAFKEYKKLEKTMPGLRKPWNKGYMLSGDFTKESDQYFPFDEALTRWGKSFAALGITFHGGTLQLDLLDRNGKYENGFCHWPDLVHYEKNKRQPGSANFTCNVVYGQVGSAEDGYNTLFHEGGHAAHLLNSRQTQVCVNNEYPPASTAWDETQSMFLDAMLSSIEWTTRYAKNKAGEVYPLDLFHRELKKLHRFTPLSMMGINSVMTFERRVYETKHLTQTKLKKIAKETYRQYSDTSVDSYRLLSIPHIYSWESSCSYHGYGLAQIAVAQWRQYFYKKYDYIVDNKQVGKELAKMWQYGSAETFKNCVKLATGKNLSAQPYLKAVTASLDQVIKRADKRIARLKKVRPFQKPIDLDAHIKMVHGKKVVATNKKSFEDMSLKYAKWLQTQKITK